MTLRGCLRRVALALAASSCPSLALAANVAAELEAPSVEVVGTTPLPGLGSPIAQVPANVQVITDAMLAGRQATQLADQLRRLAGSVSLNEAQANPYQPDFSFRGFAASPLLGTPQGLSVFQDGVRINEGFGDAVNWDLLPTGAISSVQLLPGSHAVFGFNTLGGALVVNTKSGFRHPGGLLRAGTGSHGRAAVEFAAGGGADERDFFAAGEFIRDRGWREHSGSRIDRVFAKVGTEGERDDLDVSLTLADNTLSGTQALPASMLDRPRQAYTWPDTTENRLVFMNARGSKVGDDEVVVGNLYYRGLESRSLNSNVNDACTPRCAVNDALRLSYDRLGGGLQLTRSGTLFGRDHRLSLGLSLDFGSGRFIGEQQDADFTADRGTAGVGPFALRTRLAARQQAANLYASDTLSLTPALHLTASLSASRAAIAIRDASGAAPALDGDHRFFRVNPGIGLAWSPTAGTSWFADLSQGMRVPTPMELTCADAGAPCQLPNVFLADPPLKPVLARTLELGVRRRGPAGLAGSLALFRTELADDIQFVANSAAANAGYFQNIGRTRRQGLEAALETRLGEVALALRYSLLEASYRSGFTMPSANNSSADAAGGIAVSPGDRLPGIPRQMLKVSADWTAAARTRLAADLLAQSAQYARGDENNRDAAGPVPGFAVVNLEAERRLDGGWRLTAALDNVFDRRYASFGVLGRNFFVSGGFDAASARAEQFRSPGAPRALWLALTHSWEKETKR